MECEFASPLPYDRVCHTIERITLSYTPEVDFHARAPKPDGASLGVDKQFVGADRGPRSREFGEFRDSALSPDKSPAAAKRTRSYIECRAGSRVYIPAQAQQVGK